MSIEFVIVPVVVAAWPAFMASAAAAAAALGFRCIKAKENVEEKTQAQTSVEVELQESEFLADKLKGTDSIVMQKEDITITFYVNTMKKFVMHISGENKSRQELETAGKEVYNKIKQAYAYSKVTTELKKKGFVVSQEDITPQGSIRLKLTKYN
ncbi:MAG: hypothetical protein A2Y62_05305 [Candidatus Fischerbacteria bacterium RBG_13_37_8]|uniref:DUF1257 domain-containing protein n=1 Tax=Candidatus Fischerbacteria bacterium RBG_13_37_8 TaxID=1817863 RepID=A0A1F5VYP9_9BACT|nr:MAG: hypothetical protein A2Y62_05305 [Candidatus Fischerbacteria bacterium RBG_13_37_8]